MFKHAQRLTDVRGFGIDRTAVADADRGSRSDWPVLRMENLDTDLPLPPEAIPETVRGLELPAVNSWLPFTGDMDLRAAVSDFLAERTGHRYDPEREILITSGGTVGDPRRACSRRSTPATDWRYVADLALLLLTTNLFNLLDLRPGRVEKAFAALLAGLCVGAWTVAPLDLLGIFIGPVLVGFAFTLRERAMLGDTGSNLIGALAGISYSSSSATMPGWRRWRSLRRSACTASCAPSRAPSRGFRCFAL